MDSPDSIQKHKKRSRTTPISYDSPYESYFFSKTSKKDKNHPLSHFMVSFLPCPVGISRNRSLLLPARREIAVRRMGHQLSHTAAHFQGFIKIDACIDAAFLTKVQDVFCCHVACCTRNERTAAHTGKARIKLGEAALHARKDIGHAKAPRVMEMQPPHVLG